MRERYFDLKHGWLAVESSEPQLLELYARIFDEPGRVEPPAPPCFRLRLATGEPAEIPAGATILSDGPVLDEGRCVAAEVEGRMLQVFPGKASLRLSLADHAASIVAAPGEERRVAMNLGMLALEAALRASGQVPIHAAGLTLPDGRMVLIIGRSGAGKTTTALALCGAGFGLCSDDLILCRVVGDGVVGWGLPRSLKVHRHSAALLPWTEPLLVGTWSAEDEKALPLARLREAGRVEDGTPRPLAAICVLERSREPHSALAPIGQAELLGIAAADHLRTSAIGVIPGHAGHLAALAAIIRRLPAQRIVAGTNPADLGPLLLGALQSEGAAAAC